MDIISLLLTLLVIGLIIWFAFWAVDASGIPSPMNWIIKAIVLVVGLLWLFGGSPNVTLPHL